MQLAYSNEVNGIGEVEALAETSNWIEKERESDHIINLYCFVRFSNFALLSPAPSPSSTPSPTPSAHLRLSLSVILFRIRLQLEFIAKCLWLFNVFNWKSFVFVVASGTSRLTLSLSLPCLVVTSFFCPGSNPAPVWSSCPCRTLCLWLCQRQLLLAATYHN